MFAEGVAEGSYQIEAALVAEGDTGEELTCTVDDGMTFPPGFVTAASVELELRAVKPLRQEQGKTAGFVAGAEATADGSRNVLTRSVGRIDVPVYTLANLKAGDHGVGPAILEEDYFTCRVLDGWSFVISDAGDILLKRKA